MLHAVSLPTITIYSGKILQPYLNTQTAKPVWQTRDLFSSRNSPTECWCYFISHPVKPACALHCVPYYFSVITLHHFVSKMSLVTWTCLQTGILCPLMCMTVGDSTWAFVLAATEIWSLSVTSQVTSFKIPLTIFFVPMIFYGALNAHRHIHNTLQANFANTVHAQWRLLSI